MCFCVGVCAQATVVDSGMAPGETQVGLGVVSPNPHVLESSFREASSSVCGLVSSQFANNLNRLVLDGLQRDKKYPTVTRKNLDMRWWTAEEVDRGELAGSLTMQQSVLCLADCGKVIGSWMS